MTLKKKNSSEVAALRSAVRTLQRDADAQLSITAQVRALRSAFVTLSDAVIEEADTIRAAVSAQALETDRELSKCRSNFQNSISKAELQATHNTLEEITSAITKITANINHLRDASQTISKRITTIEDTFQTSDKPTLTEVRSLIRKSESRTLKQLLSEATEDITSKLGSLVDTRAREFLQGINNDLIDRMEQISTESKQSNALLARDVEMLADTLTSTRRAEHSAGTEEMNEVYNRIKRLNDNFNGQIDLIVNRLTSIVDSQSKLSDRMSQIESKFSELQLVSENIESEWERKFSLLTVAIRKLSDGLEQTQISQGYLS
ncbi:hypothetical protein RCL1_001035 [Eukaryota sp. TZLM3-RCL]